MNSSRYRDAYFYAALQSPGGLLSPWLRSVRLLTPPQLALRLAPLLFLLLGFWLGYALLASSAGEVGWLHTGGAGLRAFALEPVQLRIEQGERGPRLHLHDRAVLLKYRADRPGAQLQVHTPEATVVARQAVFFTAVGSNESLIGVQRGELVVFADDKSSVFAGPGDLLRVTGTGIERRSAEHRHFASLDLIFPRPTAPLEASVAAEPIAQPPPAAEPVVEAPAAKPAKAAKRKAAPGYRLLPRKPAPKTQIRLAQRQPVAPAESRSLPPAPAATESTPVDDELGAPVLVAVPEDADLGAPVIVPLDQGADSSAPPGAGDQVFETPTGWWE